MLLQARIAYRMNGNSKEGKKRGNEENVNYSESTKTEFYEHMMIAAELTTIFMLPMMLSTIKPSPQRQQS